MEPVQRVRGIAAPLPRVDVDTDQIIPKQFLKRVERTGYGRVLFYDWRTRDDGTPDPEFVLNRPPWNEARILVAGRNFGCGSSREHAVWALVDFGFRAVVAPSFADIFRSNAFQSGLVPVQLPPDRVERLLEAAAGPGAPDAAGWGGYVLTVDVEERTIRGPDGFAASFELDPFRRRCLLEGLDDIDLTLARGREITAFEATHGPPSWA
jgi:3-isopropylmalate/(R)-2-methylmalate dehydratase small subunit